MLRETGFVSEIIGNQAVVLTQSQLACQSCKRVDACGNGIIEKFFSGKTFATQLPNLLDAKVGDQVTIEIEKSSVTKASIIIYLIPLVGLISFALSASLLGWSENFIIFCSILGLIFSLFVTKFYNNKIIDNEHYLPKMVSVVVEKSIIKDTTGEIDIKNIN